MVLGGASMALIASICLNKRFRLLHFMWVQWEYTCRLWYMYFGFCRLLIIRMPFLKATWKSYSIWWLWYLTNFWEPRRQRGTRRSGVMECWGGRSGVMECWGGRSGVMECWGGRSEVMECWGGSNKLFLFLSKERSQLLVLFIPLLLDNVICHFFVHSKFC